MAGTSSSSSSVTGGAGVGSGGLSTEEPMISLAVCGDWDSSLMSSVAISDIRLTPTPTLLAILAR